MGGFIRQHAGSGRAAVLTRASSTLLSITWGTRSPCRCPSACPLPHSAVRIQTQSPPGPAKLWERVCPLWTLRPRRACSAPVQLLPLLPVATAWGCPGQLLPSPIPSHPHPYSHPQRFPILIPIHILVPIPSPPSSLSPFSTPSLLLPLPIPISILTPILFPFLTLFPAPSLSESSSPFPQLPYSS